MTDAQENQGLKIRRHQRRELRIAGVLRVENPGVRFASGSGYLDGVPVSLEDVSGGGTGIASPVFIPRNADIRVTIPREARRPIEVRLRVMRVRAADQAGGYQIGARFTDPDADHDELFALADSVSGEAAP